MEETQRPRTLPWFSPPGEDDEGTGPALTLPATHGSGAGPVEGDDQEGLEFSGAELRRQSSRRDSEANSR
eukprot:5659900-Karenia_brevis.AAC.1